MRKLNYLMELRNGRYGNGLLALDENGELWFGALEITEDKRRVIDWTPVNTPRDGVAYSEPQLSFLDKWERKARERLGIEASGKTVPLETSREDEPNGSGPETEDTPDDSVEDGEGDHPAQ